MGGLLKECGCFDGPFSEDDPVLVSVRCDEHVAEGNLHGYRLMRRNSKGRVYISAARPRKMAVPKSRRR